MDFNKFLKGLYGEGREVSIHKNELRVNGIMYGDDECFDSNDFYQYFVSDSGVLYKVYYDISESTKLDTIQYENPDAIERLEEDYFE